tara:strand:- start:60 stop:308 length:249 start_codon:yes stop_codon:yes gene_type:complete
MKKLFIILTFIICSNFALAEEPEYDDYLNENIKKYGWKIQTSKITTIGENPAEIHTLTKSGYILKCITIYRVGNLRSYCETP